jgi:hypothetical protein
VLIVPVLVVSVLIAPVVVEVVSVVTEVESEVELEPPLPQAANAPNTSTNNNFFIVSLFIVCL